MKWISILIWSLLIHPSLSFATITVNSVSGTSNYVRTATEFSIIAGISGTCSTTPTGTCDTCASCPRTTCTAGTAGCCGEMSCCACNSNAVTASTILTITFQSSTVTTGLPKLVGTSNSVTSTSSVGTGGNFTFTAEWNDICNLVKDGGGTCASITDAFSSKDITLEVGDTTKDSATIKFKIYKQSNATSGTVGSENAGSLIKFTVYPGDEKVYVEDPIGSGSFPQSDSGLIQKIRFYISRTNLKNTYLDSTDGYQDLDVDSEGGLTKIIDNLENDVTFHFRAASIDEAGNVFNAMDDTVLSNAAAGNCSDLSNPGGGGDNCLFQATPSRVLGLLTEDLNCFVTTAAYGSSLDNHVQTFRDFRFKVLLPSKMGRQLNYAYYKYGPYASRFIADHEWARVAARGLLWPAWGLAKISVEWHLKLWQTLLIFATAITAFVFGSAYTVRRVWAR